jgi:hypothetical protein
MRRLRRHGVEAYAGERCLYKGGGSIIALEAQYRSLGTLESFTAAWMPDVYFFPIQRRRRMLSRSSVVCRLVA